MSDHYQTLGVAKNATPDDIKKAYRRMAGIHHPDKGGDTAQFQKIQEAYETLSDPAKKQQYDNPNPFGQGTNFGGFPGGFHFSAGGFNINEIFGTMFGQGFAQKPQMPSYRTTVLITLEQAYTGVEQQLHFNINGRSEFVKIQVPKGISDGQTIRYDNLIKDAILLIEFRIQPNGNFDRDGNNLYSVQNVSVLDLIVGGEFDFTTISGKNLKVKINPKTQPGTKIRLQNEGMPAQVGYGDQFIVLKPFIPDIIDQRINDCILQYKQK